MNAYRMLWQKRADGGAKLVRLYGTSPQIRLPDQIEGHPLAEIAPYCFAKERRFLQEETEETITGTERQPSFFREICQAAAEEVELPDSVEKIGNCAFYNCRNLKTIQAGSSLQEIGSDAFMNAFSFHRLILSCEPEEKSGVRQVLHQVSWDLEVLFQTNGRTAASLFYPEYYESYDEIAPAHLFGRSIQGEGFRARQCIKDGRVDFDGYDAVFLQACAGEPEEALIKIALGRLKYPYGLCEKQREIYGGYIKAHGEGAAFFCIRRKDLGMLEFLCRERLLCGASQLFCMQEAQKAGWTEGAAYLLQCLSKKQKERKSRYDFGG